MGSHEVENCEKGGGKHSNKDRVSDTGSSIVRHEVQQT